MAKQDTEAKVPADAVGKVTVETKEADGDVVVQTLPAGEARAQTTPQRATRQTRDQRQRTRQQAQVRRQQTRQQQAQQTPAERQQARQAARQESEEERSVKISLSPRQWAIIDRQLERTGQDAATWFRRFLSPHLRG